MAQIQAKIISSGPHMRNGIHDSWDSPKGGLLYKFMVNVSGVGNMIVMSKSKENKYTVGADCWYEITGDDTYNNCKKGKISMKAPSERFSQNSNPSVSYKTKLQTMAYEIAIDLQGTFPHLCSVVETEQNAKMIFSHLLQPSVDEETYYLRSNTCKLLVNVFKTEQYNMPVEKKTILGFIDQFNWWYKKVGELKITDVPNG